MALTLTESKFIDTKISNPLHSKQVQLKIENYDTDLERNAEMANLISNRI